MPPHATRTPPQDQSHQGYPGNYLQPVLIELRAVRRRD